MDVLTLTLNPCVDRTLWPDGRVDWQSGGKGVNVARVLANLGADCLALAPVGGAGGQTFAALARQEGVRLEEAPIQAQTRTVDTYVSGSDYAQRVVVGRPPQMTPGEVEALYAQAARLIPQAKVFCVCGSACCLEAAQAGARLIQLANRLGVPTLLDANGPMLTLGVEAKPKLIKPNQKELGQLLGREIAPGGEEAAAQALLQRGIQRVLVSLGEAGAALFTQEQSLYCPAPKVQAGNPVGSGDSFVAGYLFALLRGQSDWGALAYACAAGAANAAMFPAARVGAKEIQEITGYVL